MGLYRRKDSKIRWMSFSVNGKQYQRSTETKDERLAESILAKVKTQIIEGKWFINTDTWVYVLYTGEKLVVAPKMDIYLYWDMFAEDWAKDPNNPNYNMTYFK